MHALHYVEKATGGRGQKGGLSAYAEAVGKSRPRIMESKDAAEVFEKVSDNGQVSAYLDKAAHLAAIHKLPRECWGVAESINSHDGINELLTKAAHLAAIHKLPSRSRSPCNARTVTSCRWGKFWDMSQDWRKFSTWNSLNHYKPLQTVTPPKTGTAPPCRSFYREITGNGANRPMDGLKPPQIAL